MDEGIQNIRIGRGQGCDVLLTHASISRRHAELTVEGNGAMSIRDLDSSGGTFILRGGKEIEVSSRTSLRSGDCLRLGDYEISVTDLLDLAAAAGHAMKPAPGMRPVEAESGDRPRTRMVRCDCGTIKERGKECPSCGS